MRRVGKLTTITLLLLLVCNVAFGATSSYSPPTKKTTSTSTPVAPSKPTVNLSKPAPTPPDTTSKPSSYTPPSKTTAPASTASSYTPPNQTTQAKQAAPTTTQPPQQTQQVQQQSQPTQYSQHSQPSTLGVGLGSFAGGMILGSLVTPRQQVVMGSNGVNTTQPVYPFWYYPIKILFDLITFALICLAIWYGWKRYKQWRDTK